MTRLLLTLLATAGFVVAAQAGGPPPVYVVVDKVVFEPSADAPERIKIHGSFVRLENVKNYEYGKPVEGFVYLSLPAGNKAKAELEKWQKAAGTGKVVAVGSCHDSGSFLTAPIHKRDARVAKPDAAYSTGEAGVQFGHKAWESEPAVKDLLAFVKARKPATQTSGR